jgi:phosphatidylglycerophosphate synthase
VRLWGLTARERLERIAAAQGMEVADDGEVEVDLGYAFDPAWLRFVAERPGHALTLGGKRVISNAGGGAAPVEVKWEESQGIENNELRKRERPFLDRLAPDTVRSLERASYFGAYKGVTDLLTKYLWPEWALVLTRIAARWRISPNQVTLVGALLCVLATWLFWIGWYWTGLAAGLAFMVLDTVDGKLARCTITSSKWGEAFDHGIDLIHPPFWWYAWEVGLVRYGCPLAPDLFWGSFWVIVAGYVVQRAIEGAFILLFKMHIHVWQRFDSRFRLVTARRNPNMAILVASLLIGRPDWGIVGVAAWTGLCLVVQSVRLLQAMAERARGREVKSWLA